MVLSSVFTGKSLKQLSRKGIEIFNPNTVNQKKFFFSKMEYFLEGIALLRKIFSSELQIYQSSPPRK